MWRRSRILEGDGRDVVERQDRLICGVGGDWGHWASARAELQKEIDRVDRAVSSGNEKAALKTRLEGNNGRRRRHALAGRKVPPKYRSKKDPKLTWAGRGATAVWMRDEMKAGK